jgi:hypothetical protein
MPHPRKVAQSSLSSEQLNRVLDELDELLAELPVHSTYCDRPHPWDELTPVTVPDQHSISAGG